MRSRIFHMYRIYLYFLLRTGVWINTISVGFIFFLIHRSAVYYIKETDTLEYELHIFPLIYSMLIWGGVM